MRDLLPTEGGRIQEGDVQGVVWVLRLFFWSFFATLACVQVTGEALSLEQSRAPGHDSLEETALETTIQSLPSSSSEKGNSEKSPLVTPSAASLVESVTQGREGRSCKCGQDVPQPHKLLREGPSFGCSV